MGMERGHGSQFYAWCGVEPMKFICRYCKVGWEIEITDPKGFDRIFEIQQQECFITRRGVCHELKAVIE